MHNFDEIFLLRANCRLAQNFVSTSRNRLHRFKKKYFLIIIVCNVQIFVSVFQTPVYSKVNKEKVVFFIHHYLGIQRYRSELSISSDDSLIHANSNVFCKEQLGIMFFGGKRMKKKINIQGLSYARKLLDY